MIGDVLPFARKQLDYGRRQIAKRRLQRGEARPLRVPCMDGKHSVLFHKSTRKPGWWQATYFDGDEPWGDSESNSFAGLIEHVNTSGMAYDWRRAEDAHG